MNTECSRTQTGETGGGHAQFGLGDPRIQSVGVLVELSG